MQHQAQNPFFPKSILGWVLILLLLTGCTQVKPNLADNPDPISVPNIPSEFDELLAFSASMAKSSPALRTEVCRTLLKRQKKSPEIQIQFQLLAGRLFSESCGDIPKIIDAINTVPPELLTDERLQKLVTIHIEALKRNLLATKKIGLQEHKPKIDKLDADAKNITNTKKDETNLLRNKLQAIRSLEKHLDNTGAK